MSASRLLVLLIAVVCAGALAAGCGSKEPAPAASTKAFAGLWKNLDASVTPRWLVIEADGDVFTVTAQGGEAAAPDLVAPLSSTAPAKGVVENGRLTLATRASSWPTYSTYLTLLDPNRLQMTTAITAQGLGNSVQTEATSSYVRGTAAAHSAYLQRAAVAKQAKCYDDGVELINDIVSSWSFAHDRTLPSPDAISSGGAVGTWLKSIGGRWPLLSDGTVLAPGQGRNQYTFMQIPGGFALRGTRPDGKTLTVTYKVKGDNATMVTSYGP